MKRVKVTLSFFAVAAFFIVLLGLSQLIISCKESDKQVAEILPQACRDCHGSIPEYALFSAKAGYEVSGHNVNGNSFYSNGNGCQRCHTHEGFLEFLEVGTVDNEGFIISPSQPSCFSCHNPHSTGDFSLRTINAVTLTNDEQFDGGKGNLCVNCHQSRTDASAAVVETEAAKVSFRFGPHHGPQGDLFAGTNAYEFPGKTYISSAHSEKITDSCVTCHKSLPEGRFSLSPNVGGHSFNISGDVHENEKLNVAGCIECHTDIKQEAGDVVFNKKGDEDYDQDGLLEPFQIEVRGLLDKFKNAEGSGYLQTMDPPFYNKEGRWQSIKEGKRPVEQMAALFNYSFFIEDRSLGMHNPEYTIQILYDTIAALDPAFDSSKRP